MENERIMPSRNLQQNNYTSVSKKYKIYCMPANMPFNVALVFKQWRGNEKDSGTTMLGHYMQNKSVGNTNIKFLHDGT
jgi:hypothetical protein